MNQDETWLLKEKYAGEKTAGFFADCKRLSAGEPLAYVIGHTPFLTNTIWLDSRPLIPRPETEFWVEKVTAEIARAAKAKPSPRVLDLCAGSGCIGIAIKKALPIVHVDFAEIDESHHSTILKNWHSNADAAAPSIVGGNLFENVHNTYDFIVTNPPYIDPTHDRSEQSVRNYEPHQALYGGADGLVIITEIVANAPKYLTTRGQVWIEHEPEHTGTITQLASLHGFSVVTRKDQYDIERYSVLVLQ